MIQSGLTAQLVGDVSCSISSTVPGVAQANWDGQHVAIAWLPDGWCPAGSAADPVGLTITGACVPLAMSPVNAQFKPLSGEPGFGDFTCTIGPATPILALMEVHLGAQ